jgi:Uma2 family endonuclease
MPSTLIPVEQYLKYPGEYEPDADYVDGEIELRPMGQYDHSTWQTAVLNWFLAYSREWKIRARCELRIRISPTRYRVPDVVVFDRARPVEQILTHPPLAVFEVLSPEDRLPRMMIKLADYEAMGIPFIRLVDPASGAISAFARGVLAPVESDVELVPGSSCLIDWTQVRTLLDD